MNWEESSWQKYQYLTLRQLSGLIRWRRNAIRSYGYSLTGMCAVNHVLRVWGKRLSVSGEMWLDGIEDIYIAERNVNGDVLEDFVWTTLLPLLQLFNGTNSHSVVVMDNASIHHVHKIVEMIHGVGALVRFLPSYSPDLDPVEEAFSKVKSFLKANILYTVHYLSSYTLYLWHSIWLHQKIALVLYLTAAIYILNSIACCYFIIL